MPYFGVPIRNGLPIGLGSQAGFGIAPFDPRDLFSAGEQGAWYDPSDFSTLFTDSAGTTPVTGVEQFVGRMLDKSGRGNHATSTGTKRPKLAARYNLLTYSEQFDNGVWSKLRASVSTNTTIAPDGTLTADTLIEDTSASITHTAFQSFTSTSGASYTWSGYFKAKERSIIQIGCDATSTIYRVEFDLSAVAAVNRQGSGVATITAVGNGWYRVTATATATGSGTGYWQVYLCNATGSNTYTGDGTSGIYIWGADLRPASQATGLIGPTYQRVAAATDYDTVGFLPYLAFDGVDDSMSTGSIDFTATDKMTVWAGVRKLSDANTGTVAQLSPSTSTNNGVFGLYVPFNTGASADFAWQSKGTTRITVNSSASTGPATSVFTGIGNISAPLAQLRQNAIQVATSSASQGTGNFGNFVLNVGEGAGFLNGWLTSLIVRGAQSTQSQIEATESWVNGKTGAF